MMHRQRFYTDPFTDLLFNALLGFVFLFMVAILFMNPIAKLGTANLKAEFIITLTWPDNQPDDLDIWVEDPHGEIVSYLQREAGWLHLDRDDRGSLNDTIEINGQKILHPINQEVVTMRGIISGEYVVNVYYYESVTRGPVSATVQIDKINPVLETVFFDRVVLEKQDVEKTVVRFRVSDRGEVVGVDRRPRRLTPYALEG
jgi:uncharacterized protein YfaP (DUF2135 family)